jgi:hypothetical protein
MSVTGRFSEPDIEDDMIPTLVHFRVRLMESFDGHLSVVARALFADTIEEL